MPEPAPQQLVMLRCMENITLSTTVVSWCFCTAAHEYLMHLLHMKAQETVDPSLFNN